MKRVVRSGVPLLFPIFLLIFAKPLGGYAAGQDTAPAMDPNKLEVARAIKNKHEAKLMDLPGVLGMGVGLTETGDDVCIHVYIDPMADEGSIPAELDGMPVRVIESSGFKAQGLQAQDGPPGSEHRERFDLPVPMGVSTGNVKGNFSGTLGFRVKRKGRDDVGYITNNHIAAATGPDLCPVHLNPAPACEPGPEDTADGSCVEAPIGALAEFATLQCQPGLDDAVDGACAEPAIGELVQVIPLIVGAKFFNTVDVAFVRSNRGCVSKEILDIGAPRGAVRDPELGQIVEKSGAGTGLTRGEVMAVDVSLNVDYGDGCGTARFVHQALVEPIDTSAMSLSGDSGAPFVDEQRRAVGLNFAGDDTIAAIHPISRVLAALGVEIDTAPDDLPSATCP